MQGSLDLVDAAALAAALLALAAPALALARYQARRERRILAFLRRGGPATAAELAQFLGSRPRRIRRSLARLERRHAVVASETVRASRRTHRVYAVAAQAE